VRDSGPAPGTPGTIRPPVALLQTAVLAIVLSAALLLVPGKAVDLVGYLLTTVIAALGIVGYRALDSRSRSRAGYVAPRFARILPSAVTTWVLLVLSSVIGAAHVWRFADAIARQ
jgi:hypothetical protein